MNSLLRRIPMLLISTKFDVSSLDVGWLMRMGVKPCNILWDRDGSYAIVPVQHVDELMTARMYAPTYETARSLPDIRWEDARQIEVDLGLLLSRRSTQ